jgi:Fe-Mn family superoxide dismutase
VSSTRKPVPPPAPSPAADSAGEGGPFELPPLPWDADALEPVLSKGAVELHHGKHHRGYLKKLNALAKGGEFENQSLEAVVRAAARDPFKREIFNNAAQAWNHEFFFEGLRAPGPAEVPAKLRAKIDETFGSLEALNGHLVANALERFGSGWVWLSLNGTRLEISSSPNAGTVLTTESTPLLAIDVWEHAYYLDYHERREAYVKALLATLVDWKVVSRRAALDYPRGRP